MKKLNLTHEQIEQIEGQSLTVLHLFRQGMGTIELYYPKQYGSNKVYVKGAPVKPEFKGKTKIARGTHVMDWDKTEHFSLSKGEIATIIGELSRVMYNYHLLEKHPEIYMTTFPLDFIHYPGSTSTEVKIDISNKPNSIFVLLFRVKELKLACGLSKEDTYELIESLRAVMYAMCTGEGQRGLYKKFGGGKKGWNNKNSTSQVKEVFYKVEEEEEGGSDDGFE